MNLSVGVVGLPNSGKSTLFNALLKKQIAQVAEYPYTTIEPNVGVVEVPDDRLKTIARTVAEENRKTHKGAELKVVPAAIKFIDIAGLIKGAHQGESLGNQFLAHIREVDAILHVVRAFENPKVPHVRGEIDPKEDIEVVNLELELGGIKKPTIYILNVDEKSLTGITGSTSIKVLEQDAQVIPICAKLEAELSDLSEEEQKAYLKELGIEESGLEQTILESYKLLDLITFFTIAGGKQAQAWPVKKGTMALDAAEKVHTDFAKGFIAAEIVAWEKLVDAGSWQAAREKGLIKVAGRDQIIEDGEVIEFKFHL